MDQRAVNQRLTSARAQGLLEPVFNELERRIVKADRPFKPEDPSWPLKRAHADGKAEAFAEVLQWLQDRSKGSPDGAENTED